MRVYQYQPLEPDEIRLLELQAGDVNTDLHGHIHRYRLPEDDSEPESNHEVLLTREGGVTVPNTPHYSALSYVWGDVLRLEHTINIFQDGGLCPISIKTNLYDALKCLRKGIPANCTRLLWVDALSINQDDNFEKSSQVQKMAMIYNRAETVSVWLGQADRDSGRAMDFIERLLRLEDFDPLTADPGSSEQWAALHNLMQRPWFNRRWIVQEIALARSATLYCGDQSVSWEDFSAATSLFAARYRDLRQLFQGSKEFHNHPNYLGEVEALGAKALVDITTNLFRKDENGLVLERLLSLEALISTLTLFEAGSPHDTIYAILWLSYDAEPHSRGSAAMSMGPLVKRPARSASDVSKMMAETHFQVQPHSILVDYDANVYDVYKQLLDFVMTRSRSLDIICHPWAPEPPRRAEPLPTWIPQLSSAPFEKRPGSNSYARVQADSLVGTPGLGPKLYSASGKTKMYPERDFIRGRTLIVTGFILDAIKVKKTPAVEGVIPSAWLDLVDWPGPLEPVPDALWRLLVGNRGPGGRAAPAYYPIACRWVFEQKSRRGNINTNELLTHGKCPSIATEFLRRVQSVVWDRALVLTSGRKGSKPLLALVPADAEPGDLICVLYGCSVPVVLRQHRKRKAHGDMGDARPSSRTESTFSSTAGQQTPDISFSRGSSSAAVSDTEGSNPHILASGLHVPSQNPDLAFQSTGVRKHLHRDAVPSLPTQLEVALGSQHQYTFVGECYVHGMMAGEGFKHSRDHGNKLRAFHLV